MKIGAYGEPSSSEKWPCLLVQVGPSVIHTKSQKRAWREIQVQRQSKQCSGDACSDSSEDNWF